MNHVEWLNIMVFRASAPTQLNHDQIEINTDCVVDTVRPRLLKPAARTASLSFILIHVIFILSYQVW